MNQSSSDDIQLISTSDEKCSMKIMLILFKMLAALDAHYAHPFTTNNCFIYVENFWIRIYVSPSQLKQNSYDENNSQKHCLQLFLRTSKYRSL